MTSGDRKCRPTLIRDYARRGGGTVAPVNCGGVLTHLSRRLRVGERGNLPAEELAGDCRDRITMQRIGDRGSRPDCNWRSSGALNGDLNCVRAGHRVGVRSGNGEVAVRRIGATIVPSDVCPSPQTITAVKSLAVLNGSSSENVATTPVNGAPRTALKDTPTACRGAAWTKAWPLAMKVRPSGPFTVTVKLYGPGSA